MLQGELHKPEIGRAFWRPDNHLDHRHMVMFSVLQMIGDGAEQVGHYFLLVLNLRNERFEVLDSMRSLEDEALSDCCNTLIGAIKQVWTKYEYEEKSPYPIMSLSILVFQSSPTIMIAVSIC